MTPARVYGWAFDCAAEEVTSLLEPWNGKLGAVLYRRAYPAAKRPGTFAAFVGNSGDAANAAALARDGAKFAGAIYLDEDNGDMTGREYAQRSQVIAGELRSAGIPFWGMSTRSAPAGGPDLPFLRTVDGLMDTPVTCWNSAGSRRAVLDALLRHDLGPWLLSPHPYRFTLWPIWDCAAGNWALDLLHGLTAGWYAKVAGMANVQAVAIWSLRAYGPGHHGIYTSSGRLTSVGRPLWRSQMGNARYPRVGGESHA